MLSSSMLSFLLIIVFIGLTMGRQIPTCPPHPAVFSAAIVPSGPVPYGSSVQILCYASLADDEHSFTKIDTCINGRYVPGVRSCRPHVNTPITK